MHDEEQNKLDIKLWNLVKDSSKKLKKTNYYSVGPQKSTLKNVSHNSTKNFYNSNNIVSKKQNIKSNKVGDGQPTLSFINETNNIGIRNKDLRKLKSGKFTIHSKLDLHGYKLLDAEKNFYNFIFKSHEQGNRNLLVITGKGQDGEGKIRKNLHSWIHKSNLSKLVIFYSHASSKDGGKGAFYIRLRKNF